MKEIILKGLSEIMHLVKSFEKTITSEYNLLDVPYNRAGIDFPMSGSISFDNKDLHYKFHGSSCLIKYNNLELDFYNNTNSANRIGVTLYYFTKFLQSSTKDQKIMSLNPNMPLEIENEFKILIEEDVIDVKNYPPGVFGLNESKIM